MKRPLRLALLILWVMLLLSLGALWVVSNRCGGIMMVAWAKGDLPDQPEASKREIDVTWFYGRLCVRFIGSVRAPRNFRFKVFEERQVINNIADTAYLDRKLRKLQFRFAGQEFFVKVDSPSKDYQVLISVPLLFLIASIPVPFIFLPALRRRYRLRHGLCKKCGYDLRESPERCPECGAAVHAKEPTLWVNDSANH